jgi:Protein of unknown function (DUF1566)
MEKVMSEGSNKTQEISLGSDFDAVVRYGGTTVELSSGGDVVVKTKGNAVVYTNGDVKVRPAANDDNKPKTAPEIGDEMDDATIYAGISPDTHQPMYARPKDELGTYTFNEAAKHAKNFTGHGHDDFHVPSKGELNVLWENRNKGKLKGTFNETGSNPAGWYWSSSPYNLYYAWAQRFSDGFQINVNRDNDSSLRCVR